MPGAARREHRCIRAAERGRLIPASSGWSGLRHLHECKEKAMAVQDTPSIGALADIALAQPKSPATKTAGRTVRRLPVQKAWPTWALVAAQAGILLGALALWEVGARAGRVGGFFWSHPGALAATLG